MNFTSFQFLPLDVLKNNIVKEKILFLLSDTWYIYWNIIVYWNKSPLCVWLHASVSEVTSDYLRLGTSHDWLLKIKQVIYIDHVYQRN